MKSTTDDELLSLDQSVAASVARRLGLEAESPLAALVAELCAHIGLEGADLIATMIEPTALRRWSIEPDTAYHAFDARVGELIDNRPPLSDAQAERSVLSGLRHLRSYLNETTAPGGPLATKSGEHFLSFLTANGGSHKVLRVFKLFSTSLKPFMTTFMALANMAEIPPGLDSAEAISRHRLRLLTDGVELCWRPLLLAYLAMIEPDGVLPESLLNATLGPVHSEYEKASKTHGAPTALLNQELVFVRNADAHRLLSTDVGAGTMSAGRKTRENVVVGPWTPDQVLSRLTAVAELVAQGAYALAIVLFQEVFDRLDRNQWRLIPGQPLIGSTSVVLKDAGEARAAKWMESLRHRVRKVETAENKRPDFEVRPSDGGDLLFAEAKTLEGPGEESPILWRSLFNTISNDIRHARKQFDSVDPNHKYARVLVLLSDDLRVHGQTMIDFFSGAINVDGELIQDLRRYRLGRVRGDIGEIDLYAMLDKLDGLTLFFCDTRENHLARLQRLFVAES